MDVNSLRKLIAAPVPSAQFYLCQPFSPTPIP